MHPWVKGTQVCSNEGPHLYPRGDNYEIAKIHWQNLKIFSRTTGTVSTKLGTKHLWVKEIEVCSNKEPFNSQKEDNGFFLLLINVMIKSYVLIDLNCFLRWAMWPMGLLFYDLWWKNQIPVKAWAWYFHTSVRSLVRHNKNGGIHVIRNKFTGCQNHTVFYTNHQKITDIIMVY